MSTIRWMCSMLTGHPSSHHPQVVHPHTASSVATCVIMSGPFHAGASAPVGIAVLAVRFRGEQKRRLVEQMLALFDHEILGIQRLAGVDGGAVDRAAAAFEARAHVEQLLPRVLLDLRDAEGFRGFEILDRREPSARTQVAEEKIERPENQMTQLGERKTKQQREHAQHVHQPQPSMVSDAGAERALDSSHDASHVCPFVERGMRRVDARALEHQAGDGGQHHHRHREASSRAGSRDCRASCRRAVRSAGWACGTARRAPSISTPRISSRKKVSIAALK